MEKNEQLFQNLGLDAEEYEYNNEVFTGRLSKLNKVFYKTSWIMEKDAEKLIELPRAPIVDN